MKHRTIFLSILLIASIAVAAMAGTKIPYDSTSRPAVPIQNVTSMAPTKGASGCVTKAMTKGSFGNTTTMTGYMQYEAEVVTAAGAAEPVKWKLDGTQVAVGPNFKMTNEGGAAYSRAALDVYSAASRNLTHCGRRR
jgi:hypothetical protein